MRTIEGEGNISSLPPIINAQHVILVPISMPTETLKRLVARVQSAAAKGMISGFQVERKPEESGTTYSFTVDVLQGLSFGGDEDGV